MCQMGPYGLVMTGKDVYSMAFNQAVVSTKLLLGYHPSMPFGFSFFFSALALAPVKLISFFHPPPPLSLLLRLMQNPSTPVIKISPCLLFSAERTCKIKAPAVAFYFLFFFKYSLPPSRWLLLVDWTSPNWKYYKIRYSLLPAFNFW